MWGQARFKLVDGMRRTDTRCIAVYVNAMRHDAARWNVIQGTVCGSKISGRNTVYCNIEVALCNVMQHSVPYCSAL